MPAGARRADRKDALAEDREQQQDAAGEPPAGLDEHQRRDVRMLPHVAQPLQQVGNPRQRQPSRDARRCVRRRVVARPADEQRRHEERRRVEDERDVAARQRRHQTANRRAERQHRRPRRARQRVGRHQLVGRRDVGNRRRARRLEEGLRRDRQRHHDVRDPHLLAAMNQQQPEDQRPAQQVHRDHQAPAIHAIDDDAGNRTDDGNRQELHDHHPRDGGRRIASDRAAARTRRPS